jgi:hypothetical protein
MLIYKIKIKKTDKKEFKLTQLTRKISDSSYETEIT